MDINSTQESLLRQKNLIKSHHRFKDAIREHYRINDTAYKKKPLFYKIMLQEARFNIAFSICCSIFGRKAYSIKDIKELCLKHKIASPNSVIAIITLLKTTNRIRTFRNSNDRRKVLIEPTQKGIDELKDYMRGALEPLILLYPWSYFNVNLFDDNTQRHNFFCRAADYLFHGLTFKKTLPEVELFIEKDGGRMIMLYLYLQAVDKMNSCSAIITYSASVLAKEFLVSRTHINLIISSAQEAGYLYKHEDNTLEIYPCFIQLVEDYAGLYFSYTMHYLNMPSFEFIK
jgi:DNA-binding MarR family transcriptional regulator